MANTESNSSASDLVQLLRRVVVPAAAGGDTKAALAQLLFDAAREIEQTGGMMPANSSGSSSTPIMPAARLLDRWRPMKMLEASPAYVKQVESLVRDIVLFKCRPEDHRQLTTQQAADAMVRSGYTLAGVDAETVIAFIGHVREHGRPARDEWHAGKAKRASDKTCNDYLSALRSFFAWARTIEGSGIDADPCQGVKWVGGRRRGAGRGRVERRAFTAAEARAIIAGSPQKWAEWYRCAAEIGMRAGAFECLMVEHFEIADRGAARIRPTQDLSRKGLPDMIPISPEMAEIVAGRIARGGLRVGDLVFGKRPARKTFFRHVEAAGIAPRDERGRVLGLHSFRRFVGTELQRQGVPIKVAQQRLGHANIETTLRYYSDHRADEHQDASEKLQSVLDGVMGTAAPAMRGAAPVGRTTGTGLGMAQGPVRKGFARTEPYQLDNHGQEWALQGSKEAGDGAGRGVPQEQVLQETAYRAVRMLLSNVAPERVAMVLRALAAALDGEASETVSRVADRAG